MKPPLRDDPSSISHRRSLVPIKPHERSNETDMQATSLQTIRRTFAERRPLLMSVVVLGWSIKYTVSLGLTHTTGPEVYGVMTAALSTCAAIANLVLLRSTWRPAVATVATVAILILWALIALAGIGGTIAHIVGPVPGHGPMDLRPRPVPAPLVFALLGLVGGFALFSGQRARMRRAQEFGKE